MNIKVGIVVTTHYSNDLRPNGNQLIQNFLNSSSPIKSPHTIYVYDNSSSPPLNIDHPNVKLTYIKDQTLRGLSGTWNDGAELAIEDGCDIVLISNDDVEMNDSVNIFIEMINNHEHNKISIYGPVSNGILSGVQRATSPINTIVELTGNRNNMVNGFFFGFTKEFYHNFKMKNGRLIDEENFPWGGNEEEFQLRIWEKGARSCVLGHCYLFHHKFRGWKQLMNKK